jgi:hypothetical protein
MIQYENDCVDCGLPCLGDSCPYRNVPHLYCDECKCEADKLREYEGEQLCEECLLEKFKEVSL